MLQPLPVLLLSVAANSIPWGSIATAPHTKLPNERGVSRGAAEVPAAAAMGSLESYIYGNNLVDSGTPSSELPLPLPGAAGCCRWCWWRRC